MANGKPGSTAAPAGGDAIVLRAATLYLLGEYARQPGLGSAAMLAAHLDRWAERAHEHSAVEERVARRAAAAVREAAAVRGLGG